MPNEAIATVLAALRDDLKDNAGLPTVKTSIAGRAPRAVKPEDCPCLAVLWAGDDEQSGFSSSQQISGALGIECRYYEESVTEAQTLVVDEAKAFSLVNAADQILKRLLALWNAGSFAGAWQIRPVPGARAWDRQWGLVEGVVVGAIADVIYT